MIKNVVITGVLGGIGQATAKYFSDKGYYVIGIDKKQGPLSWNGRLIVADLASEKDIISAFKDIAKTEKSINCLVNNAGVAIYKSFLNTNSDELNLILNVNIKSVFYCIKYAYPVMNTKASIINISSVHAKATSKNISVYAATKGAIVSLTKALALEVANKNIRVNCILPGAIDTQMLKDGLSRENNNTSIEEKQNELSNKTPLKRIGKPKDVAKLIYFLSTEESSFITGTSIVIDGGVLAHLSSE